MTSNQKIYRELLDRQSKNRQRMAEIAALATDKITPEVRGDLEAIEAGTPDLERQIRAARAALDEDDKSSVITITEGDAETRERIELRSKAQLTNYLHAAAQGRLPSGAEHELQAAAGVQSGIPVELWDVPGPESEQRDVTPAPGTVGVNLQPIQPALFANSIAPRLGIDMPRVPSGTFASATISTSQTADAKGKGDAIAATAGAMTVSTSTVKRVSARLELRLEDIATVGQANFESALRQNLAFALSAELDNQAINGAGQNDDLNGILQRLTDPADPEAGIETFDRMLAIFAGGVDGLWSGMLSEVGVVCGVDTYRLALRSFRDVSGQDLGAISFADYAKEHTGGFWTNSRMPDKVNHIQAGILYRMGRSAMGASGGMRTAVCPHWGRVEVDDIYTGSAKAERYFTAHVLLGDVIVVQPDAYAQVAFRVST